MSVDCRGCPGFVMMRKLMIDDDMVFTGVCVFDMYKYAQVELPGGRVEWEKIHPDTCPHAAALKAVTENPDLVLVAVPKELGLTGLLEEAYCSGGIDSLKKIFDKWEVR